MSRNTGAYVVLGKIRGVFGVKGQLRVQSFTEPAENILDYARWRVSTSRGHLRLCPLSGQWHGPGLIVKVGTEDGGVIADRESALALVDGEISVRRSELPAPAEGEVYLADLVGLDVIGLNEERLGKVSRVLDNPAHPILELDVQPIMQIPFVRGPIVEVVDLAAGQIRVNWSSDYAL